MLAYTKGFLALSAFKHGEQRIELGSQRAGVIFDRLM